MVHMPVYKTFDEVEESLTVDELLLLLDNLKKKLNFQIRLAGGTVEDEEELPNDDINWDDPFEREMAEMNQKFMERKEQLVAEGKIPANANPFDDVSIGYSIDRTL